MEKRLLTAEELKSRYFPQLGINTIRSMMKRDGFPRLKNGRNIYAIASKIDDWLENQDVDLQEE